MDLALKNARKYLAATYQTLRATDAQIRIVEYWATQAIRARAQLQRALLGSRRYSKEIKEINERIGQLADVLTDLMNLKESQIDSGLRDYEQRVFKMSQRVFGGKRRKMSRKRRNI